MRGVWRRLFEALVEAAPDEAQLIDSSITKAHRCAAGGKRMARPVGKWLLAVT
jgi:hypothetical protein